MTTGETVLLLGGTGRTGRRVLAELLQRGVRVRAIVRDRNRLPSELVAHPGLEVIEASVLDLSARALCDHLRGAGAVVSCLGHVLTLRGVLGPPRDLVTRAVTRLCQAADTLAPQVPVKFVLMSSVSVHQPAPLDGRRGAFERAFLGALCAVLPPAADNRSAADYLRSTVGPASPRVEWVIVRPDTLEEGDATPYDLHEGLVDGVFSPGHTHMANIAHFMAELVTNATTWAAWRGKLPVIVDRPAARA